MSRSLCCHLERFTLAAMAFFLLPKMADASGTYDLQSRCQAKYVYAVNAKIQAQGTINPSGSGKAAPLPMLVKGHLVYDEMRLDGEPNGRPRSIRYYREAVASIQVDKNRDRPSLGEDKRLIVAANDGKGTALSSPHGPLSREELDLIDIPGNTLVLNEILPNREVKPGDTWTIANAALAQLICVDAISRSDVQCKLREATSAAAKIAVTGRVDAAVGGVATEIQLDCDATFDLKRRCLTSIQMRIKERRSAGFVGPAMDVAAQVEMQIEPHETSEFLTPSVVKEASQFDPFMQPLLLSSDFGGFHLIYDRRWRVTRNDAQVVVMRLMDRGELVAQCNLSALPRLDQGNTVTIEDFQAEVQKSLGQRFQRFETVAEGKGAGGIRVLKAIAEGVVSDIPIQWRYYLVIAPDGRRLAMTYTLETNLIERFADADTAMTESIEFENLASSPAATSATPNPEAAK
jgi:hypothetical protein